MASDKNSIYVMTDLLLGNTAYDETDRVLILSADSVDLIEAVAEVAADVHVYDGSYWALERLRNYMRADNVHFFDDVYPTEHDYYDTALILVPKGRDLGRAQLWSAMQALKVGGELYIVGPNKSGAKPLIKDADALFGNSNVLDYKRRHRLAVSLKQHDAQLPNDWDYDPTQTQTIRVNTALGSLEIVTMPGVFSWDALDEGTAFLFEHLDFRDAETLLDVGCGYGIIGAIAAQNVEQVVMVDDNLLAVRCAKATLEHNGITNARVLPSNLYSQVEGQFDLIVSNPPFHTGFEVNTSIAHKIISRAPKHLNRSGRLLVVANAFLKYEDVFSENFTASGVNQKNSKYKILEGS